MHAPTAPKAAANRITWIGFWTDLGLGVGKVAVGLIAGSHALVADGLHSFSDLASDVLVLMVNRVAHEAPDAEHPYGHGKFETLGTVILGLMLVSVAGGLAWDSVHSLLTDPVHTVVGGLAIAMAVVSILSKEVLYRMTVNVGRRIRSDMLIANAWHHRSDALSSVVVLVALLGTFMGWSWLDAVGALVVAAMVAWVGGKMIWGSIQELLETSLPAEELESLKRIVETLPEVRGIHDLRARHVGPKVVLDIHLLVDPRISVSEGHQIGVEVSKQIRASMPEVADVTFHIDAEDDERVRVEDAPRLPLRHELAPIIRAALSESGLPEDNTDLTLHYLDGRIHLDLILPANAGTGPEHAEALAQHLAALPWFGGLRLLQQCERHGRDVN